MRSPFRSGATPRRAKLQRNSCCSIGGHKDPPAREMRALRPVKPRRGQKSGFNVNGGTHDRLSRALATPQCLLRVRWAHILVGVQVDDGLRSRWSTSDAEPASVDAKNCRTFGFVVEARHRRVRRRRGASACDFPGLDLTPPGPASSRVAGGRRVPRAEAVCVLTPRGPCARPEPAAACSRPASARGQRRRFFVVPSVGVRAELPCS